MPTTYSNNDNEEIRDLFGLLANTSNGIDLNIPLKAGQVVVITLSTQNGLNDVIMDFTVAGKGSFTVV